MNISYIKALLFASPSNENRVHGIYAEKTTARNQETFEDKFLAYWPQYGLYLSLTKMYQHVAAT